jgi:hypothetical protein
MHDSTRSPARPVSDSLECETCAPPHPGAFAGTKSFQIPFYLGYECLQLGLIR